MTATLFLENNKFIARQFISRKLCTDSRSGIYHLNVTQRQPREEKHVICSFGLGDPHCTRTLGNYRERRNHYSSRGRHLATFRQRQVCVRGGQLHLFFLQGGE
jgi:hypothetical protein